MGFDVDEDGTASIGTIRLRLEGPEAGRRIVRWALRDLRCAELDGLPTERHDELPRPGSETHPNGAERIDHVVAFSPNLDRTVAVLRRAGLDLRRLREGPTPAGAQRQAFYPGAAAGFYGLALATADIDATARMLGPLLGEVRDAVQPGRRIATVRREAGLGLPMAFMSH